MNKAIIAIVLNLFIFHCNAQEIKFEKTEPPFWYAGYTQPGLLLMVYGKNISLADISIIGQDVQLSKVITLDHPDYVLLDLVFTSPPAAEVIALTFSSKMKVLTEILFEIKARTASVENHVAIQNPIVVSTSSIDFYQIDPAYNEKYHELAKELHSQNKELIFSSSKSIGAGHPWMTRTPVANWVKKSQTSRGTIANLTDQNLVDRYMIQNCLWWVEQLRPDAVCITNKTEEDKILFEKINPVIQKEYPGLPVISGCNNK